MGIRKAAGLRAKALPEATERIITTDFPPTQSNAAKDHFRRLCATAALGGKFYFGLAPECPPSPRLRSFPRRPL